MDEELMQKLSESDPVDTDDGDTSDAEETTNNPSKDLLNQPEQI